MEGAANPLGNGPTSIPGNSGDANQDPGTSECSSGEGRSGSRSTTVP